VRKVELEIVFCVKAVSKRCAICLRARRHLGRGGSILSKYLAIMIPNSPFRKSLPHVNFLRVHLIAIFYRGNWKVQTNFGHEFHIPKQEKIPISSTCVRKLVWVIAERVLWRLQQQFSINMWAGVVGDWLVGQHVSPHRLAGNHYRDLLLHDLPKLLEDVPLAVRARMWYMHDGVPAHFSLAVRDVLNRTYHNRWIGRGGHTAWAPRSPDFNTLDFTCGDT
jgi:hypothetical protein